jgi:tRNA pseudouridine13 synthase
MKIKVKPEDFVVKELIDLPLTKSGDYTILRLQKRYWNTLDVINFAARKLSFSKKLFSRAGLKDRYSLSTQYISFKGQFKKPLREKNFTLTPIGKAHEAITPRTLIGNSFSITLRSIHKGETDSILKNYAEVKEYGLPNYFDEQRFGSARHRKGFFAKELMLRHYKGALKLLLCHPYREDNKQEKYFKNFCREHWGEWQECSDKAPGKYKKIIHSLMEDPKNLRNAIKTIDKDLLNLYLLAYQSYIFNRVLYSLVKAYGNGNVAVPHSVGHFLFYRALKDIQRFKKLLIPMLSEKVKLPDSVAHLVEHILDTEGITFRDFGLRNMRFRGVRFKSFTRSPILFPRYFSFGKLENDELYPKLKKMRLTFTLPPGSYATLLVKRLLI